MCHFFVALNGSIFLMVHLKLLLVKRNAFHGLCLAMGGVVGSSIYNHGYAKYSLLEGKRYKW